MKSQDKTKKLSISLLLLAILVLPAVATSPVYALTGAIWTTDKDGVPVNQNIYDNKDDVYISGGPGPNGAKLPDGVYYFQVTNPSGSTLLSTDDISNRQFTVTGGVIVSAVDHPTSPKQDEPDTVVVQLSPYADTPNPGGEYKVWVTRKADYHEGQGKHGFTPSDCKTDNFKIPGEVIPPYLKVTKFQDDNANGLWDQDEEEIDGWPIDIKSPEGATTSYNTPVEVSVSEGVWEVTEQAQDGWMQTAVYVDGEAKTVNPTVSVSVEGTSGETHEVIYGNIPLGSISGAKFYDADADGVWDEGEPPISKWAVTLTGTTIKGEPIPARGAITGDDGTFKFGDLLPGTYTVEEIIPPPPPKWLPTTDTSFTHELGVGEDYVNTPFGNIPLSSISGAKFYDADADGVWDDGEAPIKGWGVHLTGINVRGQSIDKTTSTGDDGTFTFASLLPGIYKVEEVLPTPPPKWLPTTEPSFDLILMPGEDFVGPAFGNIPLSTISGAKFYDADLDGMRDSGEPAIPGWKVHLSGTDIRGGTVDEYAFTGGDGTFKFEDLLPGDYTVAEVFPPAPPVWVATTDKSFIDKLGPEEDYVGDPFGNVCLKPGCGGLTLGFWSNKNGQALITPGDIAVLKDLNLYNPGWTYPPFTIKTQIKTYLLRADAVDMRWMLSAQLIATELDVRHGFLNTSTIVYVGPSPYVPSGFISIGEIMGNANTALSGTDRAEQEYWKNLLDGVNNNRLPFVCPTPCLPIEKY